ncbi:MAG: hypothetical protein AAF447_08945 [Myxococcota bacterium]
MSPADLRRSLQPALLPLLLALTAACSSTSVAFTEGDAGDGMLGDGMLDAGMPATPAMRIDTALEELVPGRRASAAAVYTCAGIEDFSMALMNIEGSTRDIVACVERFVADDAALQEEFAGLMECYAEGIDAVVACFEPAECMSEAYDACRLENWCLYPACEAGGSTTLLEALRGCSNPEIIGRPGGATWRECE